MVITTDAAGRSLQIEDIELSWSFKTWTYNGVGGIVPTTIYKFKMASYIVMVVLQDDFVEHTLET